MTEQLQTPEIKAVKHGRREKIRKAAVHPLGRAVFGASKKSGIEVLTSRELVKSHLEELRAKAANLVDANGGIFGADLPPRWGSEPGHKEKPALFNHSYDTVNEKNGDKVNHYVGVLKFADGKVNLLTQKTTTTVGGSNKIEYTDMSFMPDGSVVLEAQGENAYSISAITGKQLHIYTDGRQQREGGYPLDMQTDLRPQRAEAVISEMTGAIEGHALSFQKTDASWGQPA